MMGKLDRIFISIVIFSLALAAGVISQAGQRTAMDRDSVAMMAAKPAGNPGKVQLVEARFNNLSGASRSKGEKNLYPTTLWLLGSALLAMVGYKRMRNTSED